MHISLDPFQRPSLSLVLNNVKNDQARSNPKRLLFESARFCAEIRWCHAQITDRNTVNCKLDTEMGDFCSLRCYNLMAKELGHWGKQLEAISGNAGKDARWAEDDPNTSIVYIYTYIYIDTYVYICYLWLGWII